MGKLEVPITDSAAQIVEVPKKFELADRLQLALSQLGDGFFAFKGIINVPGDPLDGRTLKDLNGEVLPGTGLQVLVRDLAAMIDGIILFEKNKEKFSPQTTLPLTVVAGAVQHVILRPQESVGDDPNEPNFKRKKSEAGILSVEADVPTTDSGAVLVATVDIPAGTTQVTAAMIDNSVRDYLLDIDVLNQDLTAKIENAVAEAKLEIFAFMLGQFTTDILTEIAAGDAAVLTQLTSDVASLQAQIDALAALVASNADDIADDVDQLSGDLALLSGQVVTLSGNLVTVTGDLASLTAQLNDFINQTTAFRDLISGRVTTNEGGIISNLAMILTVRTENSVQDLRLTSIEQDISALQIGGGGANVSDLTRLAIILANTNFKIDAAILASANKSNGIFVDVFNDVLGIDAGKSDPFIHNAGRSSISGGIADSTVEAESGPVTKSPGWATVADANASDGSLVETDQPAETLDLAFTGTDLKVVYPETADGTEFDIQVDALPKVTINQSSLTPADQVVAVVAQGLANVAHTVRVTSRAQPTGTGAVIDYQANALPENDGWNLTGGTGAIQHTVAGGILTVSPGTNPNFFFAPDRQLSYQHPTVIGSPLEIKITFRIKLAELAPRFSGVRSFFGFGLPSTIKTLDIGITDRNQFRLSGPIPFAQRKIVDLGAFGQSVADFHTYEVARDANLLWTMSVDGVQRLSFQEAPLHISLPWAQPTMVLAPLHITQSSVGINMDFLKIDASGGPGTKNRIDSFIVTGRAAFTKIVSAPFNSVPDATEAMVVKSDKLNGGAITYDILDNAATPNVLVTGATPENFEALGSAQSQLRLRANISGDAELEDWAGIAK